MTATNYEPMPVDAAAPADAGALPVRIESGRARIVFGAVVRAMWRLPARALLLLLAGYQRFVSPVLPVVTLGACACRFSPSCSQYAAEAVRTHGVLVGAALALRRLLKCTPLHPGGFDPVPPRRSRPTCHPVLR